MGIAPSSQKSSRCETRLDPTGKNTHTHQTREQRCNPQPNIPIMLGLPIFPQSNSKQLLQTEYKGSSSANKTNLTPNCSSRVASTSLHNTTALFGQPSELPKSGSWRATQPATRAYNHKKTCTGTSTLTYIVQS